MEIVSLNLFFEDCWRSELGSQERHELRRQLGVALDQLDGLCAGRLNRRHELGTLHVDGLRVVGIEHLFLCLHLGLLLLERANLDECHVLVVALNADSLQLRNRH